MYFPMQILAKPIPLDYTYYASAVVYWKSSICVVMYLKKDSGIILRMGSANERRYYLAM